MKKILSVLLLLLFLTVSAQAKPAKGGISSVVKSSGVNQSRLYVSIKDAESGKIVYSKNDSKHVNPASVHKLLTVIPIVETLGEDYEFTTELYSRADDSFILKLGADPFLRSKSLRALIASAKKKNVISPKAIYIDDYIFDKNEWGEGWQWDDDLNPLMPKFSSYNIDGNLLGIVITPTSTGAPANITTNIFYPTTFINLVTTSKEKNKISFSRNNHISPDILTVEGTVSEQAVEVIPVNNPKRYFILRLEQAIRDEKFDYYGNFAQKKLPQQNIYLIDEIKTPIKHAIVPILKDSNNFVAETVFKAAGAKFVNNTGSLNNSLKMFNEYCKKEGLNNENIKIVDGSGVSKNNFITAGFMTEFLVNQSEKPNFEIVKTLLPTAGEGTLKNRMLYFKDNLRAKTGTLSDISAIAGYITSRNGKTYAFDIMISDPKAKNSDKKILEEYILRAIYTNY